MASDLTFAIDLAAVLGAIAIAIVLVLVSSADPSLFNDPSYTQMLQTLIVLLASVISYTLGKRRG